MSHKITKATALGIIDNVDYRDGGVIERFDRNKIYRPEYRKFLFDSMPEDFKDCYLVTYTTYEPVANIGTAKIGETSIFNYFPFMDDWFIRMWKLAGRPRLDHNLSYGMVEPQWTPTYRLHNNIVFATTKKCMLDTPQWAEYNHKEKVRVTDLLTLIKGRLIT